MKKTFIIVLSISMSCTALAQKKKQEADNRQAIKEFITVSNSYKSFPLHVEIEQNNTALFAASQEDTMTIKSEFIFTSGGSYIRYGDIEQISDDSLLLVISNAQQLMILYSSPQNVQRSLTNLAGLATDSSVEKMSEQFTAQLLSSEDGSAMIELKNRQPLPGTGLVKERITIKYNSQTKQPVEASYIRRTLMPVDSADLDSDLQHADLKDKLIKTKESWFLINERMQTYRFKRIDHDVDVKLPFSIAQRIRRTTSGEYIPAQGYEGYYISTE